MEYLINRNRRIWHIRYALTMALVLLSGAGFIYAVIVMFEN